MKRLTLLLPLFLACAAAPAGHGKVAAFGPFGGGATGGGAVASVNGQTGAVNAVVYADGVSTGSVQLASLASAGFAEGTSAYVATLKATFDLQASTATTVALVNFPATGKAGYEWVRRLVRSSWATQLTWSEDPANSTGLASDENSGIDDTHPLATFAELNRRIAGAIYYGVNPVVRLLSDTPITDFFQPDIVVHNSDSGGGTIAALWVIGVPAVQASGGTGALTAVQNFSNNPTNADTEITDTGVTWGSWVGFLFHRATTRAYAWVLKDLGSSTARISVPLNTRDTVSTFGGTTNTTLAVADVYQVLKVPQMPFLQPRNGYLNGTVVVQQVELIGNIILNEITSIPNTIYRTCKISGAGFFTFGQQLSNCLSTNPSSSYGGAGPAVNIVGGVFQSTGANVFFVTNGGQAIFSNIVTLQGCGLTITHGALADAINVQQFDSSQPTVTVSHKARVFISGIGGANNTSKLINVADAGCVAAVTVANIASGVTSDASPYLVRSTASADTTTTNTQITTNMCGIVPQ